jgi:hypothetical protein
MKIKPTYYINDDEFLYEVILSKGRGKLTKKCENMFILLSNRVINKLQYYNPEDRKDCLNTSILQLFSNWKSFNEKKFVSPLRYFTECSKRGLAAGFNELYPKEGRLAGSMSIDTLNSNYF